MSRPARGIGLLLLAAVAVLLWPQIERHDVSPVEGREASEGAAPEATAGPQPASASGAAPAAQREVIEPDRLPSIAARLVGLIPGLAWTAAIDLRWSAKDASGASLAHAERASVSGDGGFRLRPPAWAAGTSGLELQLVADDPLYLKLDQKRGAEILALPLVEVEVRAAALVTGSVVDALGTPVVDAHVAAFALGSDGPQPDTIAATDTAHDGRFRLRSRLAGDLLLVAMPMKPREDRVINLAVGAEGRTTSLCNPRSDLLPASRGLTSSFHRPTDAGVIVCAAPVSITGRALWSDGRPLAGATVQAVPSASTKALRISDVCEVYWQADGSLAITSSARSDGDGSFRLPACPGPAVQVTLLAVPECHMGPFVSPNLAFVASESDLAPWARTCSPPAYVELRLTRQRVDVQVVSEGKPVPRATLLVFLDSYYECSTDAEGKAALLLTPGRQHRLEIEASGFVSRKLPLVAEKVTNPLRIEMEPQPRRDVRIELVAEPPVRQVVITWQRLDAEGGMWGRLERAEDGSFTAGIPLPVGRWSLDIGADPDGERSDTFLLPSRHEVIVTPDRVPLPLKVNAAHGGRIRIEATSATGKHLPGRVTLVDADGKSLPPVLSVEVSGVRRATAKGELTASGVHETRDNLRPGHWRVVVDLGGLGRHEQVVDVRALEIADVRIRVR